MGNSSLGVLMWQALILTLFLDPQKAAATVESRTVEVQLPYLKILELV